MAVGSSYPADILNANGQVAEGNLITFLDSTNQPLTGANPIVSGALPNLGSWVSGTAKVNPVAYQITAYIEFVTAGTNTIATCVVALSADNVTFSTLFTPGASAAQNNTGAVTIPATVVIPVGWYIKLTFANGTVAASKYA